MNWEDTAKIADDWRRKNDPGSELFSRRSAVRDALGDAVRLPQPEGLAWLEKSGVVAQVERIAAITGEGKNDSPSVFAADLANLLGRFDLARAILQNTSPPQTPLWVEYHKALLALLKGEPYTMPKNLKLKGWPSTFLPHLKLAEELSAGGGSEATLREVDASFQKRNRDKRAFDPEGLDGDGKLPVQWDLRKASLLAAASQRKEGIVRDR